MASHWVLSPWQGTVRKDAVAVDGGAGGGGCATI